MEDNSKAPNVFNIQGHGNVVTTGTNNSIQVGSVNVKGDMEKFKAALAEKMVPATDIVEITEIIQQEQPDASGKLPVKVETWMDKMVKKAANGLWHVTAHTAGALLAEIIKSYYGL